MAIVALAECCLEVGHELRPAENVVVRATADHDDLMSRAALVLTHGGHGTFMRALAKGLPMVVIPGMASDQPINAAAATSWGVGQALPANANAGIMREAIVAVLARPSYRESARAVARQLRGIDGAVNGAQEIELMLADTGIK